MKATGNNGSFGLVSAKGGDRRRDREFESRGGYLVRIDDEQWELSKDVTVNLAPVVAIMDPNVSKGFRCALAHYARQYSAHHVSNVGDQLLRYLRSSEGGGITAVGLTNYRSSLPARKEWWLGVLKGFLKSWFELGYPGIDHEVIEVLDGWRLKGNEKGNAVKSLDPKEGPLDDIELEGLNTITAQLFEQGKIDLAELGQTMLVTHLGVRPVQISHLKVKDVGINPEGAEGAGYTVNMPQAKQQGQDEPFRVNMKEKGLEKRLWQILRMQADSVSKKARLNITGLTSATVGELPLFPRQGKRSTIANCRSESELLPLLRNDQLHIRTVNITQTFKKIVRLGNVRARDGELLKITSRRLRYTIGSRAAREGLGKWVIAYILDQSDTQNAGVYTDNHPNFTKVIDRAMSRIMAPLAQAFMGALVGSKADARFGDDPCQQVTDGESDVGVCGSLGYCGAFAPIACYTCIHFQPLLDAPHGEMLRFLLHEKEKVAKYVNAGDDVVIGATDRTILAVTQVMMLCEERKAKEAGEHPLAEAENG